MNGNVSNINHVVHFIIGAISFKIPYITAGFILYQLIDGFKFNYEVVRTGKVTDDIPLDFLFFSLGGLFVRYITKKFKK